MRAGGRFVWPPPGIELKKIKRVVFIAGGIGIKSVTLRCRSEHVLT